MHASLLDITQARQGQERHRVVIIGGGNAGISVAARLRKAAPNLDIAIIEPSTKHYYQPLWTLVGGGVFPKEQSEREEASVIPPGVTWIREAVEVLCPAEDTVTTTTGRVVRYDFLVVAAGIQINWDWVEGLPEALGHDGVCSNYSYASVDSTWEAIRNFRGGNAVFTHPRTPIKCGGAPQKIMYLADDHFRKAGVRSDANITFATAGSALFGVPKYAATLRRVVERKGIDVQFRRDLVAVDAGRREAHFRDLETDEIKVMPYDLLHITPPMSAPDFVKQSVLADVAGWLEVDRATLRHPRYHNVFALGDASNLPTSKTGAAIRKQAPVLVHNLLAALEGRPVGAVYDGYTACPIVTGYGRLVMAEFDYDLTPRETFPFDQSKERRSMYLLKAHALPRMYWNGILKGRV